MAKRRNFAERCCPKCGGRIGVILRERGEDAGLDLLGCVQGVHMNWSDSTGYDVRDFPLRKSS